MRWTALNGAGALFWVAGLYLILGVAHAGVWAAWMPSNPLPLGSAFGLLGLLLLLWANLRDA